MYWFLRLNCSISSSSLLKGSRRSGFNASALTNFLCCFTQFSISCSSIRCLLGFRLFVSMNPFTSSYRLFQRSSCVIFFVLVCCYFMLSLSKYRDLLRHHSLLFIAGYYLRLLPCDCITVSSSCAQWWLLSLSKHCR